MPGRLATNYLRRVRNTDSVACVGFTDVTILRAGAKSWYKWGYRSYAPNPYCRTYLCKTDRFTNSARLFQ